jgi:hypothetical protein
MGIPYENGGLVALCVNGAVITVIDKIRLLPELEEVETMVVRTDEGGLGGRNFPVVAFIEGV